jgi:hypothetical protein
MIFTFAGSKHTNYTNYVLETVVTFELECSEELRWSILGLMVANLSGRPGAFQPGDLIQEYYNRLLEFIIERKGKEFDDTFIRHVISRNLAQMARIKSDLRAGVGLQSKSAAHTELHSRPEMVTLLKLYARVELHKRRPGRYR